MKSIKVVETLCSWQTPWGFTLGQIPSNAIVYKNNYRFLQDSRRNSIERLKKEAGDSVEAYFSLPEDLVSDVERYPYTLNLLCVEGVTEDEIITSVEKIGWRSPKGLEGCSSNCELNVFSNFVHEKTFGYNPYELELSHLIRKGLMSRDGALKKISDQPRENLGQVMNTLDINERDLEGLTSIYGK